MFIDLSTLNAVEKQYYLQHVIAPRPICFASTVDKDGNVNLSPFSFFNLFSSNPPIVVFSPSRRVRDNTTKHTLENLREVPEVAINMVTMDMVQQVSLSSCDYPRGTNEFQKAGFTEQRSSLITPPLVKESKVKIECRVLEIKSLGEQGGAGNLVICEVLLMHIDDDVLEDGGASISSHNVNLKRIDQRKLQHVARLGGDWYCSVNETNLFLVPKPNIALGIGIDNLPANIRNSKTLTGNHLGQLANVEAIPMIDANFDDAHLRQIVQFYSLNPDDMENELHAFAKRLLDKGKLHEAWQVLLVGSDSAC